MGCRVQWDIEGLDLSRDGNRLAWVVNEDGCSRLYVRDLRTGKNLDFPSLPDGAIYDPHYTIGRTVKIRFSPDGNSLGLILGTARSPSSLYIVDFQKKRLHQAVRTSLGAIPEDVMVDPSLIRYSTHDGRLIPAYLYMPSGIKPGDRVPVLVSIHGGPRNQERPAYYYNGLYQFLCNQGIAVVAPNFRGSTGYGKSYEKLIFHDWGGGELGDLKALAEYLRGLDWVDPLRIGVFGFSFGGFAALSCVTRIPDYWEVGVDLFGPGDLLTFAKSIPPHWKRFMAEFVGNPDTEADFLRERSPINYVDQVRAKLLIIHGANNPRVSKSEVDQMVEALRKAGKSVEYEVFEDEGHGLTKRRNQMRGWSLVGDFLMRYLVQKPIEK